MRGRICAACLFMGECFFGYDFWISAPKSETFNLPYMVSYGQYFYYHLVSYLEAKRTRSLFTSQITSSILFVQSLMPCLSYLKSFYFLIEATDTFFFVAKIALQAKSYPSWDSAHFPRAEFTRLLTRHDPDKLVVVIEVYATHSKKKVLLRAFDVLGDAYLL